MVKGHMDIGPNLPLGLHRRFWGDFEICAINVRLKLHAVFGDFDIRKRKNLETARISKSRFMPGAEFRQSTGLLY